MNTTLVQKLETFGGFLLGAVACSAAFLLMVTLLSAGLAHGLRQPVLLLAVALGVPVVAFIGGLMGTGVVAALLGRPTFRRTGRLLSAAGYGLAFLAALILLHTGRVI